MSRTILELHVLQTVPPSNINRDDTGSPKTAVYGGARRARVSSQAWKRATRESFQGLLDPQELGTRTKRVAEFVAKRIVELDSGIERAEAWELAAQVVHAATGAKVETPKRKAGKAGADDKPEVAPQSGYLMFLSARQRDGLAALAVEGKDDIGTFLKDKDAKARAKKIADTRHSVDIALFGRMVADNADINVDAATQVAHAISVHEVDNESDYYTAVDDENPAEDTGAGMIGTVDFNSATLYRYAAVDVDQLARNLGKGLREDESAAEPVRRAVEAFISGFVTSMPTGKINAFGNHTLPDAVLVKLRDARPISFVGAFEKPVVNKAGEGYLGGACKELAAHAQEVERVYGAAESPAWVVLVGERTAPLTGLGTKVDSLKGLVSEVGAAVTERVEHTG